MTETEPGLSPPPPTASEPLLALTDVTLAYGERVLVRGLSFELRPAERLVVVGGNGSGKSSLFAVLAGLAEPAAGRVTRRVRTPGMQFQDGALWPHMSVARHLEFVDVRDDPAWRERLLEIFALGSLRDAKPERLSGGERLRLGLARALAGRPELVLLDEPLAHLDPASADTVRETLPLLLDELGAASITVTHDPDDVLLFGDRLLALTGRGSCWLGPARFALESPPTAGLAAFAGRGALLEGVADEHGSASLGLGLVLRDCEPSRPVQAYLDAASVRFTESEGPRVLAAVFVAPDRRGGSWLRIGGRLVRSEDTHGGLRAGETLNVQIVGAPRRLAREDAP
ncbi:MAG: ATP-binding cassette domain-containing protein [Planctomycetes bacterium]|nr:ATP-binding cassette domain-containing protein [Planctomycetota bacterium]